VSIGTAMTPWWRACSTSVRLEQLIDRLAFDSRPTEHWYGGGDDADDDEMHDADKGSRTARLLIALTKLKDDTRIEAALKLVTTRCGHAKADSDAILGTVALFPPERSAAMIEAIVVSHAKDALGACCALLRGAIEGPFADEPKHLTAAAGGLIALLPGDPALVPVDHWARRRHVAPGAGVVADLVMATATIDAELAQRIAEHLLAWPKTYNLDRALVPAVKSLLEGGVQRSGAAMMRLHPACLSHLEARAAEPLETPKDWPRASNIRCSCEHCTALSRFLASPVAETWT